MAGLSLPKCDEKIKENKLTHRYLRETYNGDTKFEVKQGTIGYVVDMKDYTYTCRSWQLSGIPCCHAVAAIFYLKDDPNNYMARWFWKDTYIKAYEHVLEPLNGESLWPKIAFDPILPPHGRRMPGKPHKNRRKGLDEDPKTSQLSRRRRQMKCQNCLEF